MIREYSDIVAIVDDVYTHLFVIVRVDNVMIK